MSEWVSDYTPSIQAMRETYEETHFYTPHTNSVKEKNAEFDRFLELVYQVERERIIKLLTDLNVVRRCGATDKLVAFDTDGKEVLYLTGLEQS